MKKYTVIVEDAIRGNGIYEVMASTRADAIKKAKDVGGVILSQSGTTFCAYRN